MVQELPELQATNSPSSGQTPKTTSESSGNTVNTPLNEKTSSYEDQKTVSKRLSDIVTLSSEEKVKAGDSQKQSSEEEKLESKDERNTSGGHKNGQQKAQELDSSSHAFTPQYFDENPSIVADTYANPSATAYALPVAAPLETKTSSDSRDVSTTSSSNSTVLSSGQRVHVMDSAEFDEMRRKLRMKTASWRCRKQKKEQSRQQKMKIQELQSELALLLEVEAQWKQYTQRSEESLEEELEAHKREIASLEKRIQDAQDKEVEWVRMMSKQVFKQ
ncbi:hypothetical protein PsorP6_010767 [Peronosclerospora sorghi]|uniref:Uncharacterized protein n=1 Tax=Peronosclerospora sorghi TaxID=230839 RepID=A0ACC0VVG2_9STRA|nr:hypothetical protein PsorP6_010767 [Peronosclerospora sorghi]